MALQEEIEREGNWLFRYRSYLPMLLLIVGLVVFIVTTPHAGLFSYYWNDYEYVCLAVSLFGFMIRVSTVGHTPAGTSGRNTDKQIAEVLNTTGIYSVVRHPLYLGNFLMYLGIALLTINVAFIAIFILSYWLYYERIMFAEEQFLRGKFGTQYLEWAKKTPAFIPNFQNYKPFAIPFSWKKVLRKEKNGLFALLLIFCVFDGMGIWIGNKHMVNTPLFVIALMSGLSYIVLKCIKKRTTWLEESGR